MLQYKISIVISIELVSFDMNRVAKNDLLDMIFKRQLPQKVYCAENLNLTQHQKHMVHLKHPSLSGA